MKIQALIVDDEPLARERLRKLLKDESEIEVIGECADGRAAVATIQQQRPDLRFLDVQMPELDGFGVLKQRQLERLPALVVVSTLDTFASRAFVLHAL